MVHQSEGVLNATFKLVFLFVFLLSFFLKKKKQKFKKRLSTAAQAGQMRAG
jgi:hypothetical protein